MNTIQTPNDQAREIARKHNISVLRAKRAMKIGIATEQMEWNKAEARRTQAARPRWHTAPDGKPCCCTAEMRRYGAGCQ